MVPAALQADKIHPASLLKGSETSQRRPDERESGAEVNEE